MQISFMMVESKFRFVSLLLRLIVNMAKMSVSALRLLLME